MARALTEKQEAYKNNRIKGMPVGKAYRAAYDVDDMSENAIRKEASVLEHDPRIAPAVAKAKEKASEKATVTLEMVLTGLLLEASANGEGCTQSARVSAWKALGDHTGGFDANKTKMEHSGEIHMTHEQWLDELD